MKTSSLAAEAVGIPLAERLTEEADLIRKYCGDNRTCKLLDEAARTIIELREKLKASDAARAK